VLADVSIAVVSAIKQRTAPRPELLPATTAVRRDTFLVIAVPLRRQSHATSVARKDTFLEIALMPLVPEEEEEEEDGAAAAAAPLALSATSAARLAISRVLAPKLPPAVEDTARSAVVVDLRRLVTPAVV